MPSAHKLQSWIPPVFGWTSRPDIFCVEVSADDEDLVELIVDQLERDGRFEVRSVNNGFGAGMLIKEFRPDLVLNQDAFYMDTKLMRRIKAIGRPILIGQVGIEPSRGEDWSVYDLLLSLLPRIVRYFRDLGVRAEVSHLAFEPAAKTDR